MGPRIYPSYQDTNLNAKGSFIVNFDELTASDGDTNYTVTVNGILRVLEYNNSSGLYSTYLNINDVVSFGINSDPPSLNKYYNVSRLDYTTDDTIGNSGLVYTYITGSTGTSITSITFTATTSPSSYNFEYRIEGTTDINPNCDVVGYADFLPITGASKVAVLTLLYIGSSNTGTWNIYSNYDSYTTPFITGVTSSELITGYTVNNIPLTATALKVESVGSPCGKEPYSGITIGSVTNWATFKTISNLSSFSANTITNSGSTLSWYVIENNTLIYSIRGNNPTFNLSAYGPTVKQFFVGNSDNFVGLTSVGYTAKQLIDFNFSNASNIQTIQLIDNIDVGRLTGFTSTGNTELKYLDLTQTDITSLNLTNNTKLETLIIDGTEFLTTISGFNNLTKLKYFNALANNFDVVALSTNLDFTNINDIREVKISRATMTQIDGLSNKSGFTYFELTDNQSVLNLDFSNNPVLGYVNLGVSNIRNLYLTNIGTSVATGSTVTYNGGGGSFTGLTYTGNNISILYLNNTNIPNATVPNWSTAFPYLKTLSVNSGLWTTIGLTGCTGLTNIDISFNPNLTSLTIPTSLTSYRAVANELTNANISGVTGLTYFDIADNNVSVTNLNTIIQNLVNYNQAGTYFRSTSQTPCAQPLTTLVTQLDAIWTDVLVDQCELLPSGLTINVNGLSYPGTGTTWYDLSTGDTIYNGTISGSPIFNTANDGFFTFQSGSTKSQAVSFPTGSFGNNTGMDFTFGGWVKAPFYGTFPGKFSTIMTRGGNESLSVEYYGYFWGVFANFTGSTSYGVYANDAYIVANQWYYIIGVYTSGSNIKLYINGNLWGTTTFTNTTLTSGFDDAWFINYNTNITSSVGEFAVYQRALSSDEVYANYNINRSKYGL